MMNDTTRFRVLFALFTLLIAYYYPNIKSAVDHYASYYLNANFQYGADKNLIEKQMIKSWKQLVSLPNRNLGDRNLKIAIGLNTNVDLILSGVDLFKKLDLKLKYQAQNHQNLNDLRQFKECFMHYFNKGSAAERSFSHSIDFDKVIQATTDLNKQWFIGGNAALMAEGISKRFNESEILLIGPVGPKLKQLLNENIKIPNQCLIDKDEVHLILEYNSKEVFENVQTPTANRFIVSHDFYNSRMEMLDELFAISKNYNSDILIISGLHLLESQSEEFRDEKLTKLQNLLTMHAEHKTITHLELASIGDKNLMKKILDVNILSSINSLGLNEQELLFLSHSFETSPHSNYYLELKGQPDLVKVIDILEWVLNKFGYSPEQAHSRLSRIHFHTLMFHLIAEVSSAKWSNTIASLVSGSKVAAKQACGFEFHDDTLDHILENKLEFRIAHSLDEQKNILFKIEENNFVKFNLSNPVIEFKRGNIKFYFTPVLVCKEPLKTVGLGDAISSSGIIYADYKHD